MADDMTLDLEAGEAGVFDAAGEKEGALNVYEVGYHLIPTLSEVEVAQQVAALTKMLADAGASLVGEKVPEKTDLAYALEKKIEGKLTSFTATYFGWVAFEIAPHRLAELKAALDRNDSVLRYLVVLTSKDEVRAVMEGAVIVPTAQAPTAAIQAPKRAQEESAQVSDEALSDALESLEKEDATMKE